MDFIFLDVTSVFWPLFYTAALLAYSLSVRKVTLFSFIFLGTLVVEALHFGIENYVKSLNSMEVFSTLGFYTWYLGFGASNLLFALSILLLRGYLPVIPVPVTRYFIAIYTLLGFLHLFTLLERLSLQSALVANSYPMAIALLTLLKMAGLIGYALYEVGASLYRKKQRVDFRY
ncbi:hypothetical protein HHX48_00570 [Salinimonas sp. HHU 13199]|uniref:Uncharacterized protein n=1 Tax=Salinimonas profundi TaxID=2729140 RepID=A0ABR8LGK4_9ALTE|nr:hypothetical protein [Salinimonas profundi]MBD3584226.1 hypothetical protein [Salinimonas profundi]